MIANDYLRPGVAKFCILKVNLNNVCLSDATLARTAQSQAFCSLDHPVKFAGIYLRMYMYVVCVNLCTYS